MLGKIEMRTSPGGKPRDGRHCDLCGCSQPAVRCDKCGCQIFCLSCDDMYHRHPKRRFHLRKAVDPTPPVPQARPVLPMKVSHLNTTNPGDPSKMPLPPPRKKKSIFGNFKRPSQSPENTVDNNPSIPKKEYSWSDRFGSIKKFMSNRPLPPLPTDDDTEQHPTSNGQPSPRGDLSFIHKRSEDKAPRLPQRPPKSPEFSSVSEKDNRIPFATLQAPGQLRNGSLETSANNVHQNDAFENGDANVWNNRTNVHNQNGHQPFPHQATLSRQNHRGFIPPGMAGYHGSMHQSSSASDLHSMNNMESIPNAAAVPPHYPHYPMNPHMPPHYPYPMYPQFPNYPQYFGNSFANLSNPPTTDGDVSDQSETSNRHSSKKYHFRKRAKRSQSVMMDRMPFPGQFYPFGPFPGYGPWGGHMPMESPPSPAGSLRSLNRTGRSRRRKKRVSEDDEDEEISASSSPLSRPKSSSSDVPLKEERRAPLAEQTSSEYESEGDIEIQRNKTNTIQRKFSDPKRTSSPAVEPNMSPKQKKNGSSRQSEVESQDASKAVEKKTSNTDTATAQCSQQQESPPPGSSDRWECKHCTFINPNSSKICQVCCKTATPRTETPVAANSRPSSAAGNRNASVELEKETLVPPQMKVQVNEEDSEKKDKRDMAMLNSALDEAEKEISRGLEELMKLKEDMDNSISKEKSEEAFNKASKVNEEESSKPIYKSTGKMRTSILDKLNVNKTSPSKSSASTTTETQTGQNSWTSDKVIKARTYSNSSSNSETYNSPLAQSPDVENISFNKEKRDSSCQTQQDGLIEYLERKKAAEEAFLGRPISNFGFGYGDRMDMMTSPVPSMYDRYVGGGGGFGMMQRSHSRASLFTGRMNEPGPFDYGGPGFGYGGGPMYRSISRGSLIGDYPDGRYSEFHNLRKPDYYLSMEELVERRRQETMRAQGLELVRMIREAEQQGFTAEDIQVALTHCGKQSPVEWLQENWRNMVDSVVTLSTNYGNDKKENDIGNVSENEARDALRMHKGNIWAAVTECVESRQRKYLELSARGNYSRKDIIESLNSSEGDVEMAYAKLTKSTGKPFLMRIWGSGEGIQNQDGVQLISDDIKDATLTYRKDEIANSDYLSDDLWSDDGAVEWDPEEDYDDEKGDLEDLQTCREDFYGSPQDMKTPESDKSDYCDAFPVEDRNMSSPSDDIFFVIPETKQDKKKGFLGKLAALRRDSKELVNTSTLDQEDNTCAKIPHTKEDTISQTSSTEKARNNGALGAIKSTLSAFKETVTGGAKSDKKSPCSQPERRTIIVKGQLEHESLSDNSKVKLTSIKPLDEDCATNLHEKKGDVFKDKIKRNAQKSPVEKIEREKELNKIQTKLYETVKTEVKTTSETVKRPQTLTEKLKLTKEATPQKLDSRTLSSINSCKELSSADIKLDHTPSASKDLIKTSEKSEISRSSETQETDLKTANREMFSNKKKDEVTLSKNTSKSNTSSPLPENHIVTQTNTVESIKDQMHINTSIRNRPSTSSTKSTKESQSTEKSPNTAKGSPIFNVENNSSKTKDVNDKEQLKNNKAKQEQIFKQLESSPSKTPSPDLRTKNNEVKVNDNLAKPIAEATETDHLNSNNKPDLENLKEVNNFNIDKAKMDIKGNSSGLKSHELVSSSSICNKIENESYEIKDNAPTSSLIMKTEIKGIKAEIQKQLPVEIIDPSEFLEKNTPEEISLVEGKNVTLEPTPTSSKDDEKPFHQEERKLNNIPEKTERIGDANVVNEEISSAVKVNEGSSKEVAPNENAFSNATSKIPIEDFTTQKLNIEDKPVVNDVENVTSVAIDNMQTKSASNNNFESRMQDLSSNISRNSNIMPNIEKLQQFQSPSTKIQDVNEISEQQDISVIDDKHNNENFENQCQQNINNSGRLNYSPSTSNTEEINNISLLPSSKEENKINNKTENTDTYDLADKITAQEQVINKGESVVNFENLEIDKSSDTIKNTTMPDDLKEIQHTSEIDSPKTAKPKTVKKLKKSKSLSKIEKKEVQNGENAGKENIIEPEISKHLSDNALDKRETQDIKPTALIEETPSTSKTVNEAILGNRSSENVALENSAETELKSESANRVILNETETKIPKVEKINDGRTVKLELPETQTETEAKLKTSQITEDTATKKKIEVSSSKQTSETITPKQTNEVITSEHTNEVITPKQRNELTISEQMNEVIANKLTNEVSTSIQTNEVKTSEQETVLASNTDFVDNTMKLPNTETELKTKQTEGAKNEIEEVKQLETTKSSTLNNINILSTENNTESINEHRNANITQDFDTNSLNKSDSSVVDDLDKSKAANNNIGEIKNIPSTSGSEILSSLSHSKTESSTFPTESVTDNLTQENETKNSISDNKSDTNIKNISTVNENKTVVLTETVQADTSIKTETESSTAASIATETSSNNIQHSKTVEIADNSINKASSALEKAAVFQNVTHGILGKQSNFTEQESIDDSDVDDSEESRPSSITPPSPVDALRSRFEGLSGGMSVRGSVRPRSPFRRMSFNSRKQVIALERKRETTEKPWYHQKVIEPVKVTLPKRSIKQQLEMERKVRKMVADRRCRTYKKAEIVVQLMDMNFEEEEAIDAANECSTLEQAISYLQQECLLCAGHFPVSQIVSMTHCQHRACRDCIRAYFTVQIRDRTILDLLCPFCNEPDIGDEDIASDYFNHLDIMLKKLVDVEIHELFQRKLRDRVLMRDPNFRWCSQCSSGFIAMPNLKRLVCPDCNAVTCASCRRLWEREHQGISCEAFAALKDATDPEAQSAGIAKLLTEDGIECPSCHFKYALAKGGCMHFRCIQCQHDFCSGCSRPFKMGQKCGVSEFCGKLGLHAHHPRNCLFYLRDKEAEDLQKLLQMNDIKFDVEPPDAMEVKSTCPVMEQKETVDGMVDDCCGKEIQEGYAGLCRIHYVEYLGQLVNKHKVDPIQIFDNDDLELVLRRANIRLPAKRYRETDAQYREKLVNLIQEQLPLDKMDGS